MHDGIIDTQNRYFYRGGILFYRTPNDKIVMEGISDSRLRKVLSNDLCDILMNEDNCIYGSIEMGDIVVVYPYDIIADLVRDCDDDFEKHMWMEFNRAILSYVNHFGSWDDVKNFFKMRQEEDVYQWFV